MEIPGPNRNWSKGVVHPGGDPQWYVFVFSKHFSQTETDELAHNSGNGPKVLQDAGEHIFVGIEYSRRSTTKYEKGYTDDTSRKDLLRIYHQDVLNSKINKIIQCTSYSADNAIETDIDGLYALSTTMDCFDTEYLIHMRVTVVNALDKNEYRVIEYYTPTIFAEKYNSTLRAMFDSIDLAQ
jgi:hypothetical protein